MSASNEAVLFIKDGDIDKEILYPEFEAILDGFAGLTGYADQERKAVFLQINPQLQITGAVFFLVPFDKQGHVLASWNIPLHHLVDHAKPGPDLGAGPIRVACRSSCPVSWYREQLWDPEVQGKASTFERLRKAIARNRLGLLEEKKPVAKEKDKPQVVVAHPAATQAAVDTAAIEAEKKRLVAEMERLEAEKQQLEAEYQQRLESLAHKHELERKTQIARLKRELDHVKEEHSAQLTTQGRAHEAMARLAAEKEQLEAEYRRRMESMAHEHETELETQISRLKGELEQVKDEYNSQLATQDQTNDAIQRLEAEKEQLEAEYRQRMESMAHEHEAELETQIARLKRELEQLKEAYNTQLTAQDQTHEAFKRLEAEKEQLEAEYRQRMESMAHEHQLQLKTQITRLKHELDLVKEEYTAQLTAQDEALESMRQKLAKSRRHELELKESVDAYEQRFHKIRDQYEQSVRDGSERYAAELDVLREQFDTELQHRLKTQADELKERIHMHEVELHYRSEQISKMREELAQLRRENQMLLQTEGGQILQRMVDNGVTFVAYHPGIEHLVLTLPEIGAYLKSPIAFVAERCKVSEERYREWLMHYRLPVCRALGAGGEVCGEPVDKVLKPQFFRPGDTDRCAHHKAGNVTRLEARAE